MTIMRGERLQHGHREKDFGNFHGNFDLNVTAEELEQQPDLQRELLENHHSGYNELLGKMEKHGDNLSVVAQQHGEQVPQTRTFEGCDDHLLILAKYAEVVTKSEDIIAETHTNNQNKDSHNNMVDQMSQEYASIVTAVDQECSRKLHDGLSAFCHEVARTRLTQIRKHARCKYLIMDQETTEDNQCKHSRGKAMRLSQIKHQARCKSKNDLSPKMIIGARNEKPQGRILRLSKMKHQARSKDNSTVKEGTEEHMDLSQYCNRFKDSNVSVVEAVPAHNFFKGARQSSIEEIQGQLGYTDSSRLRCKSLQHIPNGLPVQNNVISFIGLPNYIFQQSNTNIEGMLYVHNIQLKEYHRLVARQHRAERIEQKRALKYKQQNSKNHVLANSEAQKEFIPVKRLRLTQLRREVRTGNQSSIMQRPAEN